MYRYLIIIGLSPLFLTACNATKLQPEPTEIIDSGAVLEEKELEQEVKEVLEESPHTEADALRLLYTEAVEVQSVFLAFASQLEVQEQEALSEAIAAFSADIETLKYYMELADREPLLDEDHRIVVEITANIEDAIELFAHVMEMLQ